ncbi:hypothetical protein B0H15DRAFT_954678 [Mycena belliarum]|uniref:Uncharacterized protein n=1 Tax=Mycena belliarum TaxID=1033014 RepID=A0AAD6XJ19_9AGAR|nr:hypothetical protein B0H15DRAFT_954678 [Mycena belliae]
MQPSPPRTTPPRRRTPAPPPQSRALAYSPRVPRWERTPGGHDTNSAILFHVCPLPRTLRDPRAAVSPTPSCPCCPYPQTHPSTSPPLASSPHTRARIPAVHLTGCIVAADARPPRARAHARLCVARRDDAQARIGSRHIRLRGLARTWGGCRDVRGCG